MRITLACFLFAFILMGLACQSAPTQNSSSTPTTSAPTATTSLPEAEVQKLIQKLVTQGGCQDSTSDQRLAFTGDGGKPEQIEFRLQRKYEGSKVSTLLTVLAPKEESEKALLAFEETGKPTDIISYLAGLKKVAHLNSSNPLNFRGSKSSVQEMLGMELGQYEIVSNTALGDATKKSWAIRLKAKPELNLAYPRIDLIVSGDPLKPEKFILFDGKDEKIKEITIASTQAVQGYETPMTLEIEDLKRQQKLTLETRNIKYNSGISSAIFTEANLIKIVSAASQKLID